jgi:hypothetical protein
MSPPSIVSFANNTCANLYRAVVERLFFLRTADGYVTPPRPLKYAFRNLRYVRALLHKHIPSTVKWTRKQFYESYTDRGKSKLYEGASASLELDPLNAKDANVGMFLKAEKKFYTEEKPDAVDRAINPRKPRFNVELGCYIKPMEHTVLAGITRAFSQTGLPVVIKGFNALTSGNIIKEKWDRFDDPVAIGFDANRFDQHVSESAMTDFEHAVYLDAVPYGQRLELGKLLGMQLYNKGTAYTKGGVIRYRLKGVRMSGDMNTSLGNCVIMCGIVYDFVCRQGWTRACKKYEIINNGDDCVLIVERADAVYVTTQLPTHTLEYGFSVVCEPPVDVLEELEFCQTRPVKTQEGYVMCRMPTKAICKDLATANFDLSLPQLRRAYLRAIGDCGSSLNAGIPVMQSFYQCLIRNSGSVTKNRAYRLVKSNVWKCGMTMMAKGLRPRVLPVSHEARASFYYAFGVEPAHQILLEEYYDTFVISDTVIRTDKPVQYCRTWGADPVEPWISMLA